MYEAGNWLLNSYTIMMSDDWLRLVPRFHNLQLIWGSKSLRKGEILQKYFSTLEQLITNDVLCADMCGNDWLRLVPRFHNLHLIWGPKSLRKGGIFQKYFSTLEHLITNNVLCADEGSTSPGWAQSLCIIWIPQPLCIKWIPFVLMQLLFWH